MSNKKFKCEKCNQGFLKENKFKEHLCKESESDDSDSDYQNIEIIVKTRIAYIPKLIKKLSNNENVKYVSHKTVINNNFEINTHYANMCRKNRALDSDDFDTDDFEGIEFEDESDNENIERLRKFLYDREEKIREKMREKLELNQT